MERQQMVRDMRSYCNGAAFITQKEFAGFMGVSLSTAKRKLRGLEKIDKKYYYIRDVVIALEKTM